MSTGSLRLRIDEKLLKEASDLYSEPDLDLPAAIRVFLKR